MPPKFVKFLAKTLTFGLVTVGNTSENCPDPKGHIRVNVKYRDTRRSTRRSQSLSQANVELTGPGAPGPHPASSADRRSHTISGGVFTAQPWALRPFLLPPIRPVEARVRSDSAASRSRLPLAWLLSLLASRDHQVVFTRRKSPKLVRRQVEMAISYSLELSPIPVASNAASIFFFASG